MALMPHTAKHDKFFNYSWGQCKNYIVAKQQVCSSYMIQVIRIAIF